MLKIQKLSTFKESIPILKEISYDFQSGKKYAIMGESGSGKTTLAKALSGLEMAEIGSLFFKGKRIKGPHEVLIPGHKKIAYLSQFFELPHNYFVKDYLNFENNISAQDADWLIKTCHIGHLLDRRTYDMSGGERQRIAMAKKLMMLPELLILDEPFAHLDFANRQKMRNIISEFQSRFKTDSIFITHDFTDVFGWADELLIIRDGKLVAFGSPRSLYEKPADTYTASLLGPFSSIESNKLPFPVQSKNLSGKKLFLRPDFFEPSMGNDSFLCIVKSTHFNGYGYWAEVEVDGCFFLVILSSAPPSVGAKISLKYRSEFFWTIE